MRHIAKWMLAAGTVAAMGYVAQAQVQEGPAPTTALVTIESKGNAPVSPQTLTLQVNGRNTPIDSVTPVNPAGTELAILIDDGLRGNVALQFGDAAAAGACAAGLHGQRDRAARGRFYDRP
jgi:hypothetical protein